MKELSSIVEAVADIEKYGQQAALATVIAVRGSTYRRPGARLLVTQEGRIVGSISGGCLESDVVERAKAVMATGEPVVLTYDSMSDDDLVWGLGLGCNGVVHVLIEGLGRAGQGTQIGFLADCLQGRETGVMATVFYVDGQTSARVGSRLMLRLDNTLAGEIEDPNLAARILNDAQEALREQRTAVRHYPVSNGSIAVFIEVIQPPVSLVIFGAGQDAVPLVRIAKELGWHVTLIDSRPAYATRTRFPEADAILLARPEEVSGHLFDQRTVAVLMTHNYLHDLALLRTLLPSAARYIGVLGPKRRSERLLQALANDGAAITGEILQRLHAPVGLDIGADTPEEIALAISAEIKAVLANRSGELLRNRTGPIHDRSDDQPDVYSMTVPIGSLTD